jgi:hypothetical protein
MHDYAAKTSSLFYPIENKNATGVLACRQFFSFSCQTDSKVLK